MKKFMYVLVPILVLLLFILTRDSHAQADSAHRVVTCPTAIAGTNWNGTWLPCVGGVGYQTFPVPATAIVADQNCPLTTACTAAQMVYTWQVVTAVPATDSVWLYGPPRSTWVLASSLGIPTPTVPQNVVATVQPTEALTWTAVTPAPDSYNIYLGSSITTMVNVGNVPGTSTTFTTAGLTSGTYYFAVTAVNSAGESSQPTPVSFTIL